MGTTFFFDCFYSQRNMKPEAQSSAESEDREELSEGWREKNVWNSLLREEENDGWGILVWLLDSTKGH